MKNTLALALLMAFALCCTAARAAVVFDWAMIGNPGNADDIHGDGYGGVDYAYRISKHEVTNAQYADFLNAVDPTGANTLSLYHASMGAHEQGGIENTGTVDGSRYLLKAGFGQKPVNFVNIHDSMRFINWLDNGQGSGGTESGVYTIGNGVDEVRAAGAKFFLPSEDEWYKAAYYDGSTGSYYDYATGSDSLPMSNQPGDDPSAVNYYNNDALANGYNDGFAVNGMASSGSDVLLTDVGAYTAAASPYGTFDQGGNIAEWNEALVNHQFAGLGRGVRGSSFTADATGGPYKQRADYRDLTLPLGLFGGFDERSDYGFRVASVPEPSAIVMALGGVLAAGLLMRRQG